MELCKSANHRHNTLHQQLQLLNPPNFTLHLLLPSIHNHNCPCTIIPYLPLLVHIAAINCLEHQVLCNICVDKHSHKSAVRHHELQPKTLIHQHSLIAHTCPLTTIGFFPQCTITSRWDPPNYLHRYPPPSFNHITPFFHPTFTQSHNFKSQLHHHPSFSTQTKLKYQKSFTP